LVSLAAIAAGKGSRYVGVTVISLEGHFDSMYDDAVPVPCYSSQHTALFKVFCSTPLALLDSWVSVSNSC
jgi:hypothetical protein